MQSIVCTVGTCSINLKEGALQEFFFKYVCQHRIIALYINLSVCHFCYTI